MRFCNNCGSPLNEDRFCVKCGADNGPVPVRSSNNEVQTSEKDVSRYLIWAGILVFVIQAVMMLYYCLKRANIAVLWAELYGGGLPAQVFYFVIGMWACVPALLFILNCNTVKPEIIIFISLISLVLIIFCSVTQSVLGDYKGVCETIACMCKAYSDYAMKLIILNIVSAAAGFASISVRKR